MPTKWILPVTLIALVFSFGACTTVNKLGASDHSASRSSARKPSGGLRFMDGVTMAPGGGAIPLRTAATPAKSRSARFIPPLSNNPADPEGAQALQFKYAVVLNASVEQLTNIALLRTIDTWWGTRYCLGGNNAGCIDCSGFTVVVMRDVYGISVPRTAQEQYDHSERIGQQDLREGDLVFFHTSGAAVSHVGIYLMNNKFVHAATSGGVMVSDLNEAYWAPKFLGGGRLTASAAATQASPL